MDLYFVAIREQMINSCFAMEPTFFNMNFQDGTSERSLNKYDSLLLTFLFLVKNKKCKETINSISHLMQVHVKEEI